jgi:hypothetical protein
VQIRLIEVGPGREIAETGQYVATGDEVEVDDTLGKSLCQQSDVWEAVKVTKTAAKAKE